MILPHRNDLIARLNELYPSGIGVEVGVLTGNFSRYILENWNCSLLYSVDPWEYQNDYHDYSNAQANVQEERLKETQGKLSKFGDRSKIARMFSRAFAETLEDNSIDFVYLDARHDYASVKEDIEIWYPKVKKNGMLSGHDYANNGNRATSN